jgi:hypothetical protein
MDATLTLYMKEGEAGTIHRIPGADRLTFTIGRGGPVDLRIELPHISANQAAILPPVPDSNTWRLSDTSTNGTLVDDQPVGKGHKVELKGCAREGGRARAGEGGWAG